MTRTGAKPADGRFDTAIWMRTRERERERERSSECVGIEPTWGPLAECKYFILWVINVSLINICSLIPLDSLVNHKIRRFYKVHPMG